MPLDFPNPARIIAITGGIGMGKTTITNYLATVHQVPVLDADLYAREAVEPGSQVLAEIVERYGTSLLLPDGRLDRTRLGSIIFHSAAERLWLEQQIHPYVRDRIKTDLYRLGEQGQSIVAIAIPLLFEARMTDLVTEIWVVYAPRQQQVERMMQREVENGATGRLDLEQIHARIDSQMPIEAKIKRATVVLDNSSTVENLFRQIDIALVQKEPAPCPFSSKS